MRSHPLLMQYDLSRPGTLSPVIGAAALVVGIAIAATAAASSAGVAAADVYCGHDRGSARWSVRTLTDRDAARIAWTAVPASAAQLRAIERPHAVTRRTPRRPAERRVLRIRAILLRYQLQASNDYQLVLADPNDRVRTFLAAMPSPDCTVGAQHRFAMARARHTLERRCLNAKTPVPVTVTGVVSFDPEPLPPHSSPNGAELRPLIGFDCRRDPAVVRTTVGPTRLVSPGFGYSVAYRTVEKGSTVRATIGLFLYDDGRWRNVTPPMLRADGISAIDDVAFVDRRHGWVAAYSCATVSVYLYRTSNGGRSWQALGKPGDHSCGGGPTFLSFVDDQHGWMEPVSPNCPVGELLGTRDGGQSWTRLASGPPGQVGSPGLPCLAPIRFVDASEGWMGRCGDGQLYTTHDRGRHWARAGIRISRVVDARFDVPQFRGRVGVVAATIGTRPPSAAGSTRAVVFSVSQDGGRHWSAASTRKVSSCPLMPYYPSLWPASVVDARTWWVVSGRVRPVVQVTVDAGRQWRTVVAHGLPSRPCSIVSVSAVDANVAWVVVRERINRSDLYLTGDGGRTWHRTVLLDADAISWSRLTSLVRNCRAKRVEQTHNRLVTVTLTDGRKAWAREPRIDAIIPVVNRAIARCGPITFATE